jgi:hypothetical protein
MPASIRRAPADMPTSDPRNSPVTVGDNAPAHGRLPSVAGFVTAFVIAIAARSFGNSDSAVRSGPSVVSER